MTTRKLIVTILVAWPQFIKASPVSRALRASPDFDEAVIHSGQHYDVRMSSVFFDELELKLPDHNLGIGSGSHASQTGRMLAGIETILADMQPGMVIVYGDTNSTLAGALAAAKLNIPVAHIEAGLRSFNRRMPEEINRILTDRLSDLLLAPTEVAWRHLKNEGFEADTVHLVGDVMYDAVLYFKRKAQQTSNILVDLSLSEKAYILATIHRAENTDDTRRLRAIMQALEVVSHDTPIVFPLHPRTRKALEGINYDFSTHPGFRFSTPVGYLDMVMLEANAQLVVTDSGGVQKEAYFHEVPCVTLREETEWTELVDNGWNYLISPFHADEVFDAIQTMSQVDISTLVKEYYFGQGEAAKKILNVLSNYAGQKK